ncbi:GIMA4 GTPase, partial [Amia calva]|nr:GIMA4 GTPase [Amia calva]
MRIVLLGGRESVGNSSSGNTILGREQFHTVSLTETITKQCEKNQGEVAGRQVTIVDTPGWWRDSVQEIPERVKEEIVHSVFLCPPGPHALLLNIPMWGSFRERHRRAVEEHLELLSERVWRHTIVLFTEGEQLEETTIEQHIERGGEELQRLVEKCGNRCHVLNNSNRDDATQVTELLEKIEVMVAGNYGWHFTIETKHEMEERIRQDTEREREREIRENEERQRDSRKTAIQVEEKLRQKYELRKREIDQLIKAYKDKERERDEKYREGQREREEGLKQKMEEEWSSRKGELKEKMRKTLKERELEKETEESTLLARGRTSKDFDPAKCKSD